MLDLELIQQRVTELHLGEVEFTMRVGVSLEGLRNAPAPATISIELAVRICETLDIDLAALLGQQRPATPPLPDDDDLLLEAALARHGRLSVGELATALDWPLKRVEEAARMLILRLLGTALHLARVGDYLHLEPRPGQLPPEADATLQLVKQAQIPLTTREALVLSHMLYLRYERSGVRTALDWETTEVLIHRRIAKQAHGMLGAHPDVLYGLGLITVPDIPKFESQSSPSNKQSDR
ncbi:hypothetical protein AB0K21_40360 [Streptosporangium sp. NPDC049248]|uniref:hypothetical protein n=1 Tax=Streptosporangium sp. NPDC049248 TaxID=3155651 RepID=UPI0034186D37